MRASGVIPSSYVVTIFALTICLGDSLPDIKPSIVGIIPNAGPNSSYGHPSTRYQRPNDKNDPILADDLSTRLAADRYAESVTPITLDPEDLPRNPIKPSFNWDFKNHPTGARPLPEIIRPDSREFDSFATKKEGRRVESRIWVDVDTIDQHPLPRRVQPTLLSHLTPNRQFAAKVVKAAPALPIDRDITSSELAASDSDSGASTDYDSESLPLDEPVSSSERGSDPVSVPDGAAPSPSSPSPSPSSPPKSPVASEEEEFPQDYANFQFPLPTCYKTASGHLCCNKLLEETIVAAAQKNANKELSKCNNEKLTSLVQKMAEDTFNMAFEVFVAPNDFATKARFRDDLICKTVVDKRVVLSFATPEPYSITGNNEPLRL